MGARTEATTLSTVPALIEACRPRQWIKNLIVFAGVIFARHLADLHDLGTALGAFAIFCLLSSSTYLLNDSVDAEQDRLHPLKRHRPIPSGRLSVRAAAGTSALLALVSLSLAFRVNLGLGGISLAYFALNLLYSFALKHVVILDVLVIALGFVLRAAAGAAAIAVEISAWLLICTLLLALFLALSKRRHELVLLETDAGAHRQSLSEYSPYLLDQMISVVTASTVVCYSLYTLSEETIRKFGSNQMMYTIPFVIFGIFRYLYLIHQKGEGGNPEKIPVTDKPFIANLVAWLVTAGIVIYNSSR